MKTQIIKTAIIIVATIAATIILFKSCQPDKEEKKTPSIEVVHQSYQDQTKTYQKNNDSLLGQLAILQTNLTKTKTNLSKAQNRLLQLLNKKNDTDTPEQQLNDCDSLKKETRAYIVRTDSVINKSDSVINTQSFLIQFKDQQITMCDSVYQQSYMVNKDLLAQLSNEKKKTKRKTILNKILGAGLIIISAVTAGALIK